jgi:hypothetical protein
MKQKTQARHWVRSVSLGVALLGSAAVSQAQLTNYIVNQFDDASGVDIWNNQGQWWGATPITLEWDGAVNATTTSGPNHAGSGSMKVTADWSDPNSDQYMRWQTLVGQNWNNSVKINGLDYTNCSFDIKFDPASGTNSGGNYGYMEPAVITSTWGQIWAGQSNLPVTNGWTHVVMPIDNTASGIDSLSGFGLKMWAKGSLTNLQTFWVDNIIFNVNLNPYIPPPVMGLAPITQTPGLVLVSGAAGDYPRDMVATKSGANAGWVSQSAPVTYALTIAGYPDTNHNSFQSHIMLVPNPGTETSPDWNEPNVVFLDIEGGVGGATTATFRYKTNQPNGNTMIYNGDPTNGPVGAIGTVTSATGPIGTWAMKFLNDTNITLTAPDGTTTNFFFPDPIAIQSLFSGDVRAYFGIQKNGANNNGQSATFSRIQISGNSFPVNDTFPGPDINSDPATPIWDVVSDLASDLFVVSTNDKYWLSWSLPDIGYSLQMSTDLTKWVDPGYTNVVQAGSVRKIKLSNSALPASPTAYYRMIKRVATQLQVLMPGETAAPDTATGKTGTPTPQQAGVAFDVTVNAVDSTWHLVSTATDTVNLTSSDAGAALPPDAPLVGGTVKLNFAFGSSGSYTVTATDVTDPTKKANTGTSTTVNP